MIELNGKTITALASTTRRNILKKIKIKPMTVSEITRELSINKSAIYKHLQILQDADLITRKFNNNEFVYYELTKKGKDLIEQNITNKKIIILLSASLFGSLIFLILFINSLIDLIFPKYWGYSFIDILPPFAGFLLFLSVGIALIFKLKRQRGFDKPK